MSDVIDAFWTRQAALPIPSARPVTCLVCKRTGVADRDRPALCQRCGADLTMTRAHVVAMVMRCELRVEHTDGAWREAVASGSDTALQARYEAYEAARIAGDPRAATVETMARSGRPDPLLDLVRLWLDYQETGERYAEVQAWAARCEAVLQ
jgi:hypothetical protein